MINNSIISYLLDAHRQYGVESQVILFVVKNLMSFGMGYFFVPWLESTSTKLVWSVISGIVAGLSLIGVFFYVYGKRLRAYFHAHPFLGVAEIS